MSKGDKYCALCQKWLGNYLTGETPEGTASYYSIIRRRWCDDCRPVKRTLDVRFNMVEYRKRRRKQEQEIARRLQAATEENKALKQYIIKLREGVNHD